MSTPTRAARRREQREQRRPVLPVRPRPDQPGWANIRHMLVTVSEANLPFKGMVLGEGQVAKTCICPTGWLVICPKEEADAKFREHIDASSQPGPERALRLVDPDEPNPGGKHMATVTGSYTINVETDNEHTVEEMAEAVAQQAKDGIDAAARIYDNVTVLSNDNTVTP